MNDMQRCRHDPKFSHIRLLSAYCKGITTISYSHKHRFMSINGVYIHLQEDRRFHNSILAMIPQQL